MRRSGYQRDPVLVTRQNHFALDGMHRLKSLLSLKAKYAVCSEYDYYDDSLKVERWLRTMIAPSQKLLYEIISKFEMVRCPSLREAVNRVESGASKIALLSRKKSFVSGTRWSLGETYRKMNETDRQCEKSKVEIRFQRESEKFTLSSNSAMLFPARLSKRDVMKVTEENGLLPYKSTRYVVPIRPMGIHFPISYLQKRSMSDCTHKLEEIVNLSKVSLKSKNASYEGRKYSEKIAIFQLQLQ